MVCARRSFDTMVNSYGAHFILSEKRAELIARDGSIPAIIGRDMRDAALWCVSFSEGNSSKNEQRCDRAEHGELVKADPEEHTQGRCRPERRGGRQAAHIEAFTKNHAAAEKTDTRKDTVRHADGIDTDHLLGCFGEPGHLVNRGEHQQAAR